MSIVLSLFLACAGGAGAADLSPQFPDAATRNQCSVGSCHIFGSIGLLEAAIFRQHAKHVHLSEMDLFVQRMVSNPEYYEKFETRLKAARDAGSGKIEDIAQVSEGGFPESDLKYAVANGVATDELVSYASSQQAYERYRSMEKVSLASSAEDDIKYHKKAGAVEAWFYDHVFSSSQAELRTNKTGRHIVALMLEGGVDNLKKVRADRAKIQGLISDFKVVQKNFPEKSSSKECLKDGAAAGKAILARLEDPKHPVPVVLSMNLVGLPDWHVGPDDRDAYHAFIVRGTERKDGKLALKTRNSWGGDNPDVHEDELCRVFAVTYVEAPKDRG